MLAKFVEWSLSRRRRLSKHMTREYWFKRQQKALCPQIERRLQNTFYFKLQKQHWVGSETESSVQNQYGCKNSSLTQSNNLTPLQCIVWRPVHCNVGAATISKTMLIACTIVHDCCGKILKKYKKKSNYCRYETHWEALLVSIIKKYFNLDE